MERRSGAFVPALVLVAGAAAAQEHQVYEHLGAAAKGLTGSSVAALGDVDGDGIPDYGYGAPGLGATSPGSVRVHSGASGVLLFSIEGDGLVAFQVGRDLTGVGDLDADGRDDLLVVSDGIVRAHSGADGSMLWQVISIEEQIGFARVAGIGDVTGDGRPDALIGVSQARMHLDLDIVTVDAEGPGYAMLVSGADGTVVATFSGEFFGDAFGGTVAAAGDADADGIPDFAIGCFDPGMPAAGGGYLRLYSGATLQPLWTLGADEWIPGQVAAPMGDVDGDGRDDLIVGLPGIDEARIVSGADGSTITTIAGSAPDDGFAMDVCGVADCDGDGVPDALIGAPQAPYLSMLKGLVQPGAGYVRVVSGARGETITEIHGSAANEQFGRRIAGIGDLNGDGAPELVAGAPNAHLTVATRPLPIAPASASGAVRVVSTEPLSLASTVHELPCAAGPQLLEIDAGREHAGAHAWLVGSATGVFPATLFGDVAVPLFPDPYTLLLAAATPLASETSFGAAALDAQGKGVKKLAFGSEFCGLTGGPTTLWHAFLVLDPRTLEPVFTTNAVPLTLHP